MNVLIGIPRDKVPIPSSGPAYIAACLKRAGHKVRGFTCNGGSLPQDDRDWSDVFMTGGLACHWRQIEAMLTAARDAGKPTVLGGGIVSAEPELVTEALAPTLSVIGQGEVTAVEALDVLARKRAPETVPGLAWIDNGRVKRSDPRPDIKDLDTVPFPDYDVFNGDHWPVSRPSDMDYLSLWDESREYPLVASRSCPFHCTFCWHTSGQVYRRRSIANVIAEIRHAVERYQVNVLSIIDELFGASNDWVELFCYELEKLQAKLNVKLNWWAALRAPQVTPYLLQRMKAAGCFMVSYGFESYSRTVLQSMQKRIQPEHIDRAIRLTREAGLAIMAQFIFGDPAETLDTAEETIAYWRTQPGAQIYLGIIWVCPNSPNYQLAVRRGIIRDRLDHHRHVFRPVNLTTLSDAEYGRLGLRISKLNALEDCWPRSHSSGDNLHVTCPHCQTPLVYGRFIVPPIQKRRVICRQCRQRFQVSHPLYRVALRTVARLMPTSRTAFLAWQRTRLALDQLCSRP